MVKLPICGTCLPSLINAILTPNSMSVSPNAIGPVPLGRYTGLLSGATTPHGNTACTCTLGSAPQLNSKAGPEESIRSEEHTSELQSPCNVVCRLLLEKKTFERWDCGTSGTQVLCHVRVCVQLQ